MFPVCSSARGSGMEPNICKSVGNGTDAVHLKRARLSVGARDRLMADLAHDLRSPLNGIQGWTHVLESRLNVADALTKRALEGIMLGVQQQVQLIADFSDLFQVLRGELTIDPQRSSILPLLNKVLVNQARIIKANKVTAELLETTIAPMAWVDPERVEQALGQLIEIHANAAQAGDRITVSMKEDAATLSLTVAVARAQPVDANEGAYEGRSRRERFSSVLAECLIRLHGGEVRREDKGAEGIVSTIVLPSDEISMNALPLLRQQVADYAESRLVACLGAST